MVENIRLIEALNAAKPKPLKVLCWDTGSGVQLAYKFVRDGHKVKYYTVWSKESPEFADSSVGLGFEGMEKEKNFMANVAWADLIVFLYNTSGDLYHYLRNTTDKPIFGADDRLELDRHYLKKVQKTEMQWEPQPHKFIEGIDPVIDYVKKSPDKFIKVSTYRGDLESFHAKDWEIAKTILDVFRARLGPFENKFQFLVEDKIDFVVETGWDLWFNGKDFLRPYLWGYLFNNVYIGKWEEDELPEPLQWVADKFKPVLAKRDYHGAISCEVMITKEKKVHLLDITCRPAQPLSTLYTEGIDNYTEVFMACAKGEDVEIENISEYMGIIDVKSSYNEKHWMKVAVPKDNPRIKVFSASKLDGEVYSTPQSAISAVMLGYGDTVKDVVEELNGDLEKLDLYDTDTPSLNEKKLEEIIKAGESVGLEF